MMKQLTILFSAVIFISMYSTKVFSQENKVESMKFTNDFNVIGLKSEKQALWIDSVLSAQPNVFSCHTDFISNHTQIIVHEAFNSPQLLQNIFIKLGVEIDKSSYKSAYQQ